MTSSPQQERLEQYYSSQESRMLEELRQFLAIPSISADPAHHEDCQHCATWLVSHLENIGLRAEIRETCGQPLVFAQKIVPGKPTLLFYGHYDVQPAGSLEEWDSPPFEMTLRDGRFFARGAADDKGQVFYFLKALQWAIANDELEFSVTILLEGEEESGGKGIAEFVRETPEDLRADVLHVCDTGLVSSGDPTIMIGLRGIVVLGFELRGANRELHSGHHGSVAPNVVLEMNRVLTTFHDHKGNILVPGYCDDCVDIPQESRELIRANPFDATQYKAETGVSPLAGDGGDTVPERVGLRPTIEIHGVSGGYVGPGVKTIVPNSARALLSSRLVYGQDPVRCLESLKNHIEQCVPKGLELHYYLEEVAGPAVYVDPHNPWLQRAALILNEISGQRVYYRCNGGSIPIIADLTARSGGVPVLVGFSTDSDRIHAVNESFAIERFKLGFLYAARFLSASVC